MFYVCSIVTVPKFQLVSWSFKFYLDLDFLVHLSVVCSPSISRWLIILSTSSLKLLSGIQRNLKGARSWRPLTSLWFSGRSENRRPPWPMIGWDIFDFSSKTAERNSTKLDRKQYINVLYQVFCGRSVIEDGRPGFWLAESFLTLSLQLLDRIQRNGTGSKISMSSTKFLFSGRSEIQDGHPGLWLAKTFSTSFMKLLNGIQRNLTGSKVATSSTKGFFSGRSENQDGGPDLWLPETFSTFFSEITERNLTKLDRKHYLNVFYQVCVFRADEETKMAALTSAELYGDSRLSGRFRDYLNGLRNFWLLL